MRRIVWTDEAAADLDEIFRYIEQFDPAAASRTARRFIILSDSLIELPHRGTPVRGDMRRISIVRPYTMQYRVTDSTVDILMIRHMARRPKKR